jgi:hypothetical protein
MKNSIKNNRKISLPFLSCKKIILEDQENNEDTEVLEDDEDYQDSGSDEECETETETIVVDSEPGEPERDELGDISISMFSPLRVTIFP